MLTLWLVERLDGKESKTGTGFGEGRQTKNKLTHQKTTNIADNKLVMCNGVCFYGH